MTSGTRSQVGSTRVRNSESYDASVFGLRWARPARQVVAHSPTVVRERAGSTHSPRPSSTVTAAAKRSASLRLRKVRLRCFPAGSR